jgi:hypothetical protein
LTTGADEADGDVKRISVAGKSCTESKNLLPLNQNIFLIIWRNN